VFKSESSNSAQNGGENDAMLLNAAGSVSPVNELNEQNRAALCKTATITHMQRNDTMKPENSHRWLMYLVEGSLSLYNGKDEVGSLKARTPEALQPLFVDKSYQSVKSSAMSKLVRFGREQMDILLREQQKNAIRVEDVEVTPLDNLVFDSIINDMQKNELRLASFGESSAKILMSSSKTKGIPELAEVIQSDPGLSTHISVVANRAEGAQGEPVQTIRGAISRMGVEATNAAIADLLRTNTIIAANPVIEKRFRQYMQRTWLATAISHILAKGVPHLKADVASLVALTSDIGELMVITYANKHEKLFDTDEKLTGCITNLRGICGAWILSDWDFSPEFIDSAETARQWYRNLNGEIGYSDLMTAALLIIQSEMPDSEHSSIPSADNLLLARRLQQSGIDIKSPGNIVQEATTRLSSVQGMLKAG